MNLSTVEEFEKKLDISEEGNCPERDSFKIVAALRRFLAVQQRRAQAYARLKRGFEDYMASGVESTYQQLCSEITAEFNDCSKQVLEMESQFLTAHCFREDLSLLLRSVQNQEKMKLQLKITEASGTEEAEADAEFDNALKEAIKGVQGAVTAINEHLEEVRYEIAALEEKM